MKCIFIGGCGRSGTTMLGNILGSSRNVITTPESDFIERFIISYQMGLIDENPIAYLNNDWRFKQWAINPSELSTDYKVKNIYDINLMLIDIVKMYAIKCNKNNAKIWVDHSPKNLLNSQIRSTLFPESKFINIVRDPRAVYSSVKKLDWGPNTAYTSANEWQRNISAGLVLEKDPKKQCLTVRYEDIILQENKTIQKICEFCNIEYKDSLIEGNSFKLPNTTKNQHSLVGKKLDKLRIDHWKKKLSTNEIRVINSITHLYLDLYEYNIYDDKIYNISKLKISIYVLIDHIIHLYNKVRKHFRDGS